jgi:hypothetical protein
MLFRLAIGGDRAVGVRQIVSLVRTASNFSWSGRVFSGIAAEARRSTRR